MNAPENFSASVTTGEASISSTQSVPSVPSASPLAAPVGVLAAHAALQPDKLALISRERSLTYAQLNARANRVANALKDMGVQEGDRVAIMLYNSPEVFEATNGVSKIAGISVLLNYRLLSREVAYIVNDSGSKVVIASPELVPIVEQARAEIQEEPIYVAIGGKAPAGWQHYEELLAASSELPPVGGKTISASMSYTSGTTGYPKGAYRPDGVAPEASAAIIQTFELSSTDVHLLAGPYYHSAPNFFANVALALGATVVLMPRFDAVEALKLIDKHQVTTTFMAPTLLQRLCDVPQEVAARFNTSSLKSIILGGAPCPYALKVQAIERFGQCLWEFYGATETGFVTILRPEDQLRKPASCGQAGPGQEHLLLDAAGNVVPDGTPGEFWTRNAFLTKYYNKPEATAKSMRDGFFSVGDIAYRDSEGYYYICDRKVDMVISGGVNIYPAEIEAVLSAHPAVGDVAVIGVPDPLWGEAVKAVVALRSGTSSSAEELISFCAQQLADYKRPRSVDFVEELLRSESGKLLKAKIREPYWANEKRKI